MKKTYSLLITILFFTIPVFVFSQLQKSEQQLVKDLIEKKRSFNKKFSYGYRIQLYSGDEIDAKKIRARFRVYYPEITTYLSYEQPEWKIQVGHYKTRLQADRNLLALKNKYPYAIVVPLGK